MSQLSDNFESSFKILTSGTANGGISTSYTQILIITIVISTSILLLTAFFRSTDDLMNIISSRFNILTIAFLIAGIFLAYYATQSSNATNTLVATVSTFQQIKGTIYTAINSVASQCPTFINTLYFPFQKTITTLLPTTDSSGGPITDNPVAINYICNTIFLSIEQFLWAFPFTTISIDSFLCFFASFIVSPAVQKNWFQCSANYYYGVNLLINQLISVLKRNTITTSLELQQIMTFVARSKEFKYISSF